MRRVAACLVFIGAAFVGAASGQSTAEREIERVVVIPPDIGLAVVADQPDCPLQIEDIKLFGVLSGGGTESYKVRHRGTKPIRAYTIGSWNTAGTGWEVEREFPGALLPGHVATLVGNEVKVVELTESLRDKLGLRGGMKAVLVFMVIRVEYADGSVYDAKATYQTLKTHLDKIAP